MTARTLGRLAVVAGSGALTGALVGVAAAAVASGATPYWVVARASGIAAYLALVALVTTGLLLAQPPPTGGVRRRLSVVTRIRLHVSLAAATFVLTGLHVVVLALDEHAGLGWGGALLPMASSYRPVPVTLGILGLYAGLLTGGTAALAGRGPWGSLWWPVHKVAVVTLLLVWSHGVLAGSDTAALLAVYLATGALVLGVAVRRHATRAPGPLPQRVPS